MNSLFSGGIRGLLITLLLTLPAVILCLSIHETCHGLAAYALGDRTAANQGRLTLDPMAHIDPMGFLCMLLLGFGWAKPVPVNPRYFRKIDRDMMLVALAGPSANFLLAVIFGVLLWAAVSFLPFVQWKDNSAYIFCLSSLQAGVIINFGLGWLNLLPIPPLDGSKILAYFLPPQYAWRYMEAARYGFIILLILLFTGILNKILGPLVSGSSAGLLRLLGF